VRRGYLSIAKKETHRVKVIDTRQGEEKVFQKIKGVIDQLIKIRRYRYADLGTRNAK
jgi:thymidylate kinase